MKLQELNGEVKISLKTLAELIDTQKKSDAASKRKNEAVQMMGDFLQFLRTKQYFKDIQEEFNGSHDRLSIKVDSGTDRVVIYVDGRKVEDA